MLFLLLYSVTFLFFTTAAHTAAEAHTVPHTYYWYDSEEKVTPLLEALFKPFSPAPDVATFSADTMSVPERALIELYLNKTFEKIVGVTMSGALDIKAYLTEWLHVHNRTLDDIPALQERWNQAQQHLVTFYELTSYDEKKAFMLSLRGSYTMEDNCIIHAMVDLFEVADTLKEIFEKEATYRLVHYAQGAALPEPLYSINQVPAHLHLFGDVAPLLNDLHTLFSSSHIHINFFGQSPIFLNDLFTLFSNPSSDHISSALESLSQASFSQKVKALASYISGPYIEDNGARWIMHPDAPRFLSFAKPSIAQEVLATLPVPHFSDTHLTPPLEKVIEYVTEYRETFIYMKNNGFSTLQAKATAFTQAAVSSGLPLINFTPEDLDASLALLPPSCSENSRHQLVGYFSHKLQERLLTLNEELHALLMEEKREVEEIASQVITLYTPKALGTHKNLIIGNFFLLGTHLMRRLYSIHKADA